MSIQAKSTNRGDDAKTTEIANLLSGKVNDNIEDSQDDESLSDESTKSESSNSDEVADEEEIEFDEEDEEGESEKDDDESESNEDETSDEEVTWDNVLGVPADKIKLDENGDFEGLISKVNGETEVISVEDLLFGYQNNKSNTLKSQELSADKKEFESQKEQVISALSEKFQNLETLSKYLDDQFMAEYESIDWATLRKDDPARAALLQQDFAIRVNNLEKVKQTLDQEKQSILEEQNAAGTKKLANYISSEKAKMLDNNPAWNDPNVFRRDMEDLRDFCIDKYGATEDDFKQVFDSRIIEMIKDAKAYHEVKKPVDKKLMKNKFAKKVPKFQKSSGRVQKKMSKLERLTKAAKNAKTGDDKRDLQSSAIAELLVGG